MAFDAGALTVGGISLATIALNRVRWYVKRNGTFSWGCGCSDRPLIDDDELQLKQFELGDVKALVVVPKHHLDRESTEE